MSYKRGQSRARRSHDDVDIGSVDARALVSGGSVRVKHYEKEL